MFFAINLRKMRRPAVIILLFALLTAIIMKRYVPPSAQAWSKADSAPVLIIDAGHGGLDGGAVAENGITESSINLAIAKRLEAAAKLFGLETVMTRTGDELDYPDDTDTIKSRKSWDQKTRVELINSVDGGVLVSIHQNRFPDPRPSGAQVFYAKTAGSDSLAKLMHGLLNESLCPENRRVAAPILESIYLMRSVNCPAVLVECGFLSNPGECALLTSEGYQTKLAAIILASFLQFAANAHVYGG